MSDTATTDKKIQAPSSFIAITVEPDGASTLHLKEESPLALYLQGIYWKNPELRIRQGQTANSFVFQPAAEYARLGRHFAELTCMKSIGLCFRLFRLLGPDWTKIPRLEFEILEEQAWDARFEGPRKKKKPRHFTVTRAGVAAKSRKAREN